MDSEGFRRLNMRMMKKFDVSHLREQLWEVINDNNLSFARTAFLMRMSHVTLMAFLNDTKEPYYQTLLKIERFLNNKPWIEEEDEGE